MVFEEGESDAVEIPPLTTLSLTMPATLAVGILAVMLEGISTLISRSEGSKGRSGICRIDLSTRSVARMREAVECWCRCGNAEEVDAPDAKVEEEEEEVDVEEGVAGLGALGDRSTARSRARDGAAAVSTALQRE